MDRWRWCRRLGFGRARWRLASGAQSDGIGAPERVRVDECAGHPRFVARERIHHEGVAGNAKRWRDESHVGGTTEAEARVVGRVPLEEYQRLAALADHGQRRGDEIRADAVALPVGTNTDRTENEYVLQ